jgi:hypothetical protein
LGYNRKDLEEKTVSNIINPATGKKVAYTKANLLVLAMNWGTEKNRQRIIGGFFANENMSAEQAKLSDEAASQGYAAIEKVLENLTDKDWDFVQGVWDLFESSWPQALAVEKEATGLEIGRERPMAFLTSTGRKMRGGYFPIRYNPVKSLMAARHQAEDAAESLIKNPYDRASVAHGYTKSRSKTVNRQILLELSTIAQHLNEVAHDLTHRIAVYDVSKIINDKDLAPHLEHVLGRANYEQLNPWLKHISSPALTDPNVTQMERIINATLTNISASYLGFKFSVGLRQLMGIGPAADKIGRLRMARAMWSYLADSANWGGIAQEVFEKSSYMGARAKNFDANISAAVANRGDKHLTGARAGLRDAMFWWAGEMDLFVSIPTWMAAYERALNDFAEPGINEEVLEKRAIDYADMIVRMTQNAGSAKDLALIQRRGPLMRLFTMFYTGIGRLYNLTREEFGKGHDIRDFPRLAAHILTVYTVPYLIGSLITNRALGNGNGDEDDEDKGYLPFLWFLGKGTVSEMMRPLVGVKDLFDMATGTETIDMPTLGDGIHGIKNLIYTVDEAFDDGEVDFGRLTRATIESAGPLFALPSKQIRASWGGTLKAMENWDRRSTTEKVLKTPWDILMGPGPRRKK